MKICQNITLWSLSLFVFACGNPFYDEKKEAISYPDTTVYINSLTPQICEVRVDDTDTSYTVTSYLTDAATGRIIYKMKIDPYQNSLMHGVQLEFDAKGDTLIMAHFENGVRVDSTVYKYPNGQVQQIYYYSPKKDGNKLYQLNFHPNGQRKSDVIQYTDNLINGAVTYYDATVQNKPTETYFYINSEIVGIKIYNERYNELDQSKANMLAAYRADSLRFAEALKDTTSSNARDVRVIYADSKPNRDAMYDVGTPDDWDIMKEDPAFILKLGRQ